MTTEIANKDESLIQKKEIFGLNDLRNLLISQNTHQPTDAEMYVFKKLCEDSGANPFLRDIHVVKYGANSPASFIFGKDYFTKVARAQNAIWDCGILVVRKGESIETKKVGTFMLPTDTLVGGWCDVHTKDGTIPTTVLLEDFDTGKSLWSKMPGTMIEKCAIVKALRMAFPEKLAGAYAAEEMEQARAFDDVNLTEDINRASIQAVPLQEIEPTGQVIEHEPRQEASQKPDRVSSNNKPSDAQVNYLYSLGYADEEGPATELNRKRASELIDNLRTNKGNQSRPASSRAPAVKKAMTEKDFIDKVTAEGWGKDEIKEALDTPLANWMKGPGATYEKAWNYVKNHNEPQNLEQAGLI